MAALDHAPSLFRRGPSPLARLFFYAALSVALLILDLRLGAIDQMRQTISIVIDPLQRVVQTPLRIAMEGTHYLSDLQKLAEENAELKAAQLQAAPLILRQPQLEAENEQLRQLLNLQQRETSSGQAANILYTARDPFAHQVFIDKGQQQGILPGQPVINQNGVIGQVTQVFPFSAEVTLITDKDQAVPVLVLRTGQRSVTFGFGGGNLELRYIPANADVQEGDILVTSGLDGIYPPGLPVGKVTLVERDKAYAFARITATPAAETENHTIVMVLSPREARPPYPEAPPATGNRKEPKPRTSPQTP